MSKNDDDENPFGDPSVVNAVSSTSANVDLNDYNPFDEATEVKKTTAVESPAVMSPTTSQPPSKPQISTDDFQRRQEELERRARELDRREEELRSAPSNVRQNNWPPLPQFCPVHPCFYQDINVDIPVEFQKIVKYLYYLWIAHVSLLFANLLAGLLFLFVGGDSGATFGLALMYCFFCPPASFVCWFRPAYKAFRDDSSMYFMVFFFVFFFQMLVLVLVGSSGLILGLKHLSGTPGQIFVGVLMVIVGVGFGLLALSDFYMLVRIHRMYRSTGASMAKAQAEFTSGVMKNETVRQAAAEAARETVRSQFSAGPPPSSGDNRF